MRKYLKIIIMVVIIGLITTLLINLYMIESTKSKIINDNDVVLIDNIDAIVILGCKAYSDHPSLMLEKRLDKGIDLYHKNGNKLILTGDHGTKGYDEVNVMKNYALDKEIPSEDIFLDHAGFTTYDSLYRIKEVFNAKKIVIVTQKYHLYRALYIAKHLGIEAYGIIADDIPYKGIMIKNEIREILSRDKNFFKVLIKPKSKYLGDKIDLKGNGNITNG